MKLPGVSPVIRIRCVGYVNDIPARPLRNSLCSNTVMEYNIPARRRLRRDILPCRAGVSRPL